VARIILGTSNKSNFAAAGVEWATSSTADR
jgi:choline dehydrogenase